MALTLHQAIIPGWLQITQSVRALVDKAEAWCSEHGHAESEILGARLINDMLPFAYQVKSCWVHSALALEAVKAGQFSPHMDPPPESFEGLRDLLDKARATMDAVEPDALEALAGRDMLFTIGNRLRLEFTVQDFLLGFSQPNFYFHATTSYDILRVKGLSIGKLDYLGRLPVKP